MASTSIFDRLIHIPRNVFDNEDLVATPELMDRSVDGWDSLLNVRLFIELECAFGVPPRVTLLVA